jgi:hypothetical protein
MTESDPLAFLTDADLEQIDRITGSTDELTDAHFARIGEIVESREQEAWGSSLLAAITGAAARRQQENAALLGYIAQAKRNPEEQDDG